MKDPAAVSLGRRGGLAAARGRTPEERSALARLAGRVSARKRRLRLMCPRCGQTVSRAQLSGRERHPCWEEPQG